jgi:hypothetical protein
MKAHVELYYNISLLSLYMFIFPGKILEKGGIPGKL